MNYDDDTFNLEFLFILLRIGIFLFHIILLFYCSYTYSTYYEEFFQIFVMHCY